jgi:magnesium chelatase subunit D
MGRSGDVQKSAQRGRPLPPLKGQPHHGNRLHVLATLRHAAPRQKIRALSLSDSLGQAPHSDSSASPQRIHIRSEDFYIQKFAKRSESCIIFCIDASGSAALERLAEAKGAVELLLKDSYARRDHICVIAFRDKMAQVQLPITRSLLRAKRELQALPGGGGTPLANALRLCVQTSLQARHHGMTPTLVMLSDGRANVTLEGEGSRPLAKAQALSWARQWKSQRLQSIWLDTSARTDPQAKEIALAMDAHYVPLPHANSQRMANAVQLLKDTRS